MMSLDLFRTLVEYHATHNLDECRRYIRDGRVRDREGDNGKALLEGSDKYTPHDGLLILRNGSTLLNKLVQDGRVNADDIDEPHKVKDSEQFFDFLANRGEYDGVYVYESKTGDIYRVGQVYPLNSGIKPENNVPSDFISYRTHMSPANLRKNLGTKTRLAIELASSYRDVRGYQIKRSAHGVFGMGKVTHFGPAGLNEEFFMELSAGESNRGYVDQGLGIVGVYRRFRRNSEGRLVTSSERKGSLENCLMEIDMTREVVSPRSLPSILGAIFPLARDTGI